MRLTAHWTLAERYLDGPLCSGLSGNGWGQVVRLCWLWRSWRAFRPGCDNGHRRRCAPGGPARRQSVLVVAGWLVAPRTVRQPLLITPTRCARWAIAVSWVTKT